MFCTHVTYNLVSSKYKNYYGYDYIKELEGTDRPHWSSKLVPGSSTIGARVPSKSKKHPCLFPF